MIEKLYTVEEVAELASVTGRTIRNYQKSGRLVGRKIGGQWRFTEGEVQRLLTGAPPEEPAAAAQAAAYTTPVQAQAPLQAQAPQPAMPPVAENAISFADAAASAPAPQPQPAFEFEYDDTQASDDFDDVRVYTPSASAPPAPTVAETEYSAPQAQQPQDGGYSTPAPPAQSGFSPYSQPVPPAFSGQPSAPPQPVGFAQPQYPAQVQPVQPLPPPVNPVQEAQPAWPQPYPHGIQQQSAQPSVQNPAPAAISSPSQYGAYPAPVQVPQAFPPSPSAMGQPSSESNTASPVPEGFAAPLPPAVQPQPTAVPAPEAPAESTAPAPAASEEAPALPELSDVGKRVTQFVTEVHNCEFGPQTCSIIDLYQSLESAEYTSQRLAEIADEESDDGILCQCFVEYDERYDLARYTLFGSSSFLLRCLKLIG